jgi:hypothetical protein
VSLVSWRGSPFSKEPLAITNFSEPVSFSSLGGCDAFHLLFDAQIVVFAETRLWCRKFLDAQG